MSIGPLGFVGGAIGATGAQAKGADVERTQELAANRDRQIEAQTMAEDAAGIGLTDGENHSATDRDADGRLGYQAPNSPQPEHAENVDPVTGIEPHQATDPTGESGSQLDLSG